MEGAKSAGWRRLAVTHHHTPLEERSSHKKRVKQLNTSGTATKTGRPTKTNAEGDAEEKKR